MNSETPALPFEVRETMELLEEYTGVAATCDTSVRGRYIIEHGDRERVWLVCRYIRNSQGRLAFSSDLYQNGEKREKVRNVEAYARLFNDPTVKNPNRRPTGGVPKVHPIPEDHELPAIVEAFAKKAEASAKDGSVTTVGFQSESRGSADFPGPRGKERSMAQAEFDLDGEPDTTRYAVQVVTPEGNTVHLYFWPKGPDSDVYAFSAMAAIDADGCDMMVEFMGDMEAAVERILGFRMPASDNTPSPTGRRPDTAGAASNAVTVRRATVIRV
ncbi:hypothetical protein [Streptomyces sp. NPDC059278]|uniref:hypothetical protein n=1 Tax=Streptomyces sp. NPDC059278 TaxID=3346801 RepID=UPI003676977E